MPNGELPIHNMAERHEGLTKAVAANYTEAACVCLDRHHVSPVEFEIDDGAKTIATTEWPKPDERTKRAWANEIDATEAGAYACALAAVELTQGLVAVGRAETLTGADYYIGEPGKIFEDFEDCTRLEMSGMDRGDPKAVKQRLSQKVAQAERGKSNLPAMASVVCFNQRTILISKAANP